MTLFQSSVLLPLEKCFADNIPQLPMGKYASVVLVRETFSHSIFTTEGNMLDTEKLQAGLSHPEPIDRVVMFKRKQIAPERRTGKALLRQYGESCAVAGDGTVIYGKEEVEKYVSDLKKSELNKIKRTDECYLISNMCTHCPDCLIYGYAAVEGEGSRKSRVLTDSGFSVRSYQELQKHFKFNVIDEKKETSGTITEFDHLKPQAFIPSIETTVDLTMDEFVYVLGNILKTTRYGKESSREGYLRNHVLAIVLSDMELFSNLEFTQAYYDAFSQDTTTKFSEGYVTMEDFRKHFDTVFGTLQHNLFGRLNIIKGDELNTLLQDVSGLYSDENKVTAFLKGLMQQTASFTLKG